MKKIILASMATALTLPMPSWATPPECAQHLQEPGIGGRLSQEQIDANNACLSIVDTQKKISEGLATIADNERRSKGGAAFTTSVGRNDLTTMRVPFPQQPGTQLHTPQSNPLPEQEKPDDTAPTATVDGVLWEGGTVITGLIHLQDGQSLEAMKGTALPDGSVVSAITQSGSVIVTRNGKRFSLPSTKPPQQSSPFGNPL